MLEYLFAFLLALIVVFGVKNSAIVRHFQSNRIERETLVKKYNRLWKSRREMVGHFDWAIARKEEMKKCVNMGTEIERMDAEMKTLAEEIAMLDTAKWNLNAVIPMKSISNR